MGNSDKHDTELTTTLKSLILHAQGCFPELATTKFRCFE
jgi:hypothetical protein